MRKDIFQAIADPTRRAMLSLLATQALTPTLLVEKFDVSRQAVSKHLRILNECNLLEQQKFGRYMYYQVRAKKLKKIDHWLQPFRELWDIPYDPDNALLFILK